MVRNKAGIAARGRAGRTREDLQEVLKTYTNMVERHNQYREPNTASNYEEYRLAAGYDVNLYDICRQPREPQDRTLHIPASSLDEELNCSICTGIIRDAMVITACLHRFCANCIERHIHEKGKNTVCPVCNTPFTTRRALRPDPTFDNLIKMVYGDVDAYEKAEEARIQLNNKELFPRLDLDKHKGEKPVNPIANKRQRTR
ncbi:hypothetical protein H257_02437 [Aphanomyces astaci]|uniref:RING-type E3 ubiquitin transferase n=1 Tax=Aphanomyces astaci TaxID=112090 RepID=W4H422_APHAT|nr:hypothetical protein H257_02437 [Aphanomyces astaci]ETV85908.1 hypothetical protein H257_02437 [Aphanomyces astaci]RHX97333.1 hypothetical protein DYB25_005669 [Aphanomyces astaci]RHY12429.1 hypothetical protein DYB36_002369 [Aphanomyces astaci]RHY64210.1 hypothetical protein DYB34_006303 [Aphanomyces astaci]RQM23301.1 hypothetical protein B5M09_000683 [Aphanomyces astaci]|eukprot:XP_009824380.1 hypothetical protein H257_02437 [Aphanomyces astaci]